jgi:hypothetical protein
MMSTFGRMRIIVYTLTTGWYRHTCMWVSIDTVQGEKTVMISRTRFETNSVLYLFFFFLFLFLPLLSLPSIDLL